MSGLIGPDGEECRAWSAPQRWIDYTPAHVSAEIAALQLSIDNARVFLRGEIVGEPQEGTLAHEIWERDSKLRRKVLELTTALRRQLEEVGKFLWLKGNDA